MEQINPEQKDVDSKDIILNKTVKHWQSKTAVKGFL